MRHALSTLQVAKLLGVAVASVSKWVDQGLIQAGRTPGGHRRIEVESLVEFLHVQKLRVPPELLDRLPHRPTVLLVDDEASVRKLIRVELHGRHPEYSVLEAGDGYQAGQMVATERPTVVVLDLRMPGLDGLAVCRQIKSGPLAKHTSVIILSAFISDTVGKQLLKSGARAVLGKPFDMEALVQQIETEISRHTAKGTRRSHT